jgi:hypothetical protein
MPEFIQKPKSRPKRNFGVAFVGVVDVELAGASLAATIGSPLRGHLLHGQIVFQLQENEVLSLEHTHATQNLDVQQPNFVDAQHGVSSRFMIFNMPHEYHERLESRRKFKRLLSTSASTATSACVSSYCSWLTVGRQR